MTNALDITFKLLASTANETATPVLIHALDVPDRGIRDGALRAILSRRSLPAHREVLRRWESFDHETKQMLCERSGRLSSAIREAIFSNDKSMCAAGCEASLRSREFDLMPTIINAAEDRSNSQAELAAQTTLTLAEMLEEELLAPRDYEQRFDPQLIRQYVLGSLEQSVTRFDHHKRREIVESFLLLTNYDNATLKRILQDTLDKAYMTIIDCLTHSSRRGVIRLLGDFVHDPFPPLSTLNIISRRKDLEFVKHFLDVVTPNPDSVAQNNLKKIDSFRWLRDDLGLLKELDDIQQQAAIVVASASGMKRLQVFDVVRYLLQHGGILARREAASALNEFRGSDANDALVEALADDDHVVLARLAVQLRERGIPGAMNRLIELLDHPHEDVRNAARSGLSEFNFQRYLSAFDLLDEEVRRNTGILVKKVDLDCIPSLIRELRSPSRTRRVRALEAAIATNTTTEVQDVVIHLLDEPDQFVRLQAAKVLGHCNTPASRVALRQALLDANMGVRQEAENSLQVLTGGVSAETPHDTKPPFFVAAQSQPSLEALTLTADQ